MKTILVDAVNTFVVDGKIDSALYEMLERFPQRKIILTNADDEEKIKYGLVNLPYELFTLSHQPNKTDPHYFEVFLEAYHLSVNEVIYFEHNPEAVKSAQSLYIDTYRFDPVKRDIGALQGFILRHLQ